MVDRLWEYYHTAHETEKMLAWLWTDPETWNYGIYYRLHKTDTQQEMILLVSRGAFTAYPVPEKDRLPLPISTARVYPAEK